MSEALLGGIEAGGTKFVCGVGRSPTEILRTRTIPTRGPDETLAEVLAFFADVSAQLGPISALGVASFGPVDLDPRSPAFGAIKTTPKAGWTGFNLKNTLAEGLGCPVAIDTDVTGSGLAEWAYGAGQGLDRLAYLTVGTGIGGALIADGRPLHRYSHPEMGHVSPAAAPTISALRGSVRFTAIAWRASPVGRPWWRAMARSYRRCRPTRRSG